MLTCGATQDLGAVQHHDRRMGLAGVASVYVESTLSVNIIM
jgi:hypothetical protein